MIDHTFNIFERIRRKRYMKVYIAPIVRRTKHATRLEKTERETKERQDWPPFFGHKFPLGGENK